MAIEKDKKNLQDIQKRINKKLKDSGTKVSGISEPSPGQFELNIEVPQEKAQALVDEARIARLKLENNKTHPQIRHKKYAAGSLMDTLSKGAEIDSLQKSLDIARLKSQLKNPDREIANLDVRYRDALSNSYIDNRGKTVEASKALELYSRSEKEYYKTGIYGSTIDVLSNFASTGFYNEINDNSIKNYYDSWVRDSNFKTFIPKIFQSLFTYNIAYILNASGDYTPDEGGVSSIPGKIPASATDSNSKIGLKRQMAYFLDKILKDNGKEGLDYKEFSKAFDLEVGAKVKHPVAYTILDPKHIDYLDSGFFGGKQITITAKGLSGLKKLLEMEDKSDSITESLKLLPSKLKAAATEQKDYTFADDEISVIFLRKNDFELYSKPRGARAFDSFDYKEELKKADYATVDGIYNYILKVTVGDKDHPVTDPKILEDLAAAFDTPQKAFTIVWNHTLKIEKITAQEVGSILGKQKYEPVESDINAALGIARALIDGTSLSADAAILATKSLQSEIRRARTQVEEWIYAEYRKIAEAAAFNSYPVVRWRETVITTDSDAVTRASFMQMLDRKAMSVQTYMREVDLDYDTEVQRMVEEKPLIEADILRAGSPNQVSADSGRPKGQPTSEKEPVDSQKVTKRKSKTPSITQGGETNNIDTIAELFKSLTEDERVQTLEKVAKVLGTKKE